VLTYDVNDQDAARGGKGARTRRRVQRATLEVIKETGEFTGELVAQRAGVSTPTFYTYFATKDHAIEACLALCFEDYEERMGRAESIEVLLELGLERTLTGVVATLIAINDEYRALLRLARGRIIASRLLREQSRIEERRAYEATKRFLSLGQAAGRIRAGDIDALTTTVRTVLEGLDSWTVRARPEVITREIPDLLLRYLRPDRDE
jgi:AcrR family transcriptional regulator